MLDDIVESTIKWTHEKPTPFIPRKRGEIERGKSVQIIMDFTIKEGTLGNVTNLTNADQVASISNWLVSL